MANPTFPAAAEHRPRPTTVTVSTYLLWATAALQLIIAATTVATIGPTMQAYRDVYAGTDLEGSESVVVGLSVVGVIINVLFAIALAVLAIFNNRGRNGARITTWVLGGISLCCIGVGAAGTALTSSMNLDAGSGGPSTAELEARLAEVLPGWYEPLSVVLAVLSALAVLGAIILLALPASNAYFRKAQPAWDPSMPYPYPGQPAYPAQPPYPGQPYPGQPYQGQPQYPGQPPAYPAYPAYPGQAPGQPPEATTPPPPSSAPPAAGPTPPAAPEPPHTGSVPATDPWSAPPAEPPRPDDDRKPPSDPTAQG